MRVSMLYYFWLNPLDYFIPAGFFLLLGLALVRFLPKRIIKEFPLPPDLAVVMGCLLWPIFWGFLLVWFGIDGMCWIVRKLTSRP